MNASSESADDDPEPGGSPGLSSRTTQLPTQADLVILGAGPAALAAAWRCAQQGLQVVVIEAAADRGRAEQIREVNGIQVDRGSHRLHPATPQRIVEDLRLLLGDDLQNPPRHGRIRIASRWVRYPLHPGEMLRVMPKPLLAQIARDSSTGVLRRRLRHPDTYAGVIQAGLGSTIYEHLYAPFAQKLWGLPGEMISSRQAYSRVSADRPTKVASQVMRTLRAERQQDRAYYYPRMGFGQMTDAYGAAAAQAGAVIVTGHQVEQISLRSDGAKISTDQGSSVRATRVFSTLPLPSLVRLVRPGAPATVVEAATRLRFRGMVYAYLGHQAGRWTSYDAHYLPGDDTRISRISEPANYRDNPEDPQDRSVICVEIPATVGDAVWTLPDEQLVAQVAHRLHQVDLPPLQLGPWVVERDSHVYPVFPVGYEPHLAALNGWASQLPHLTSFGRLGLFAHEATHHALIEAYAAADAFSRGEWDEASWLQARGSFRHHVVEN